MATRKIVPRADNEGGIGTALKQWASGWIKLLTVTTINALTLAAEAVGFTIAGGTTSKTLTVDETVALSAKLTTPGVWENFTPVITALNGTFTSVSADGYWQSVGKRVNFEMIINITTNGTAVTFIKATMPINAVRAGFTGAGRETAITGKMLQWEFTPGEGIRIRNYDNSYPGADGSSLSLSGSYERV